MRVLIVDNTEPRDGQFNAPLYDLVSRTANSYDVVGYREIPALEKLEDDYDAVIVSGVPLGYSFSAVDNLLPYYDWVLDATIPITGICLGHQIIGRLFGSGLIRNKEAENGMLDSYIAAYDPIFANIGFRFNSRLMHRASIAAPDDFGVLARTDRCENIIMKHKTRPIYGMQFHPELSSIGDKIISNFVEVASAYRASKRPSYISDLNFEVSYPMFGFEFKFQG